MIFGSCTFIFGRISTLRDACRASQGCRIYHIEKGDGPLSGVFVCLANGGAPLMAEKLALDIQYDMEGLI